MAKKVTAQETKTLRHQISISKLINNKANTIFDDDRPFMDQLAVITHYLHSAGSSAESTYRIDGQRNIEALIKQFPSDESYCSSLKEVAYQHNLFPEVFNIPYPTPEKPTFTFIDLFAGMGGFRLAMQKHGGKCIFSSEWNTYAQKTYFSNFGEIPFGDITLEGTKKLIPDGFDVLCAGFPCQPFSIAGVSKKNSLGRANGFLDKTQGTLFFDVADIINRKKPKAIYLENVKNLFSHDKGRTYKVILETLENLGYNVHAKILDGQGYVPQHRERIMIVGFRKDIFHGQELFSFPEPPENKRCISEILEKNVDQKYTLSDKLWSYLQNYAQKHKEKGNGFGFGIADPNGISRTLSARYYKDGSEILIAQGKGQNPRRLTPRECARLMGYEDRYIIECVSDVQAYRQCGNSVVVPLITAVSEKLVSTLRAAL